MGGMTAAVAVLAPQAVFADVQDAVAFKVIGAVVVWSADNGGTAPTVADFIIDTGNGASAATSGDRDLIAGDAYTVVTGTLVSTSDGINSAGTIPYRLDGLAGGSTVMDSNGDGISNAADSFTPIELTPGATARVDGTTSRSSFYVASNTAFSIDARAQLAGTNNIVLLFVTAMEMQVTLSGDDGLAFGSAAQYPHTGGPTGGVTNYPSLWSLLTGRNVFTGNRRTASGRGSLADQSVRFDLAYSIPSTNLSGYDLSLGTFDFEVEVTYTVFIP